MAMECEIDKLSALPDDILTCNIFSRLSLRDVFRTSLLSSRWPLLWKEIHHLNFSEEFFQTLKSSSESLFNENPQQKANYINDVIDNILLLHSGHIERFSIHPCELKPDVLKALRIEQWVQHAALKGVKHLSLNHSSSASRTAPSLPSFLFYCHLLRAVEIECFHFTEIPTEFGGFHSLQSCYLSRIDMTDNRLEQIIQLCPLLQKLVLVLCWDSMNLKFQAPNLKELDIRDCYNLESLKVDCPQLVDLGVLNCYDLIEFKICSCELVYDLHASDVQTPKEHPMLNSLKRLSIKSCPEISDVTLLTILGCFCNLEEVHVKISEWQLYEKHNSKQERAKGELVGDLTFPSLKKVYVDVSEAIREEEAFMLAFLLNHSPSLNNIIVTLPGREKTHGKKFINKVLQKNHGKKFINKVLQKTHGKVISTVWICRRHEKVDKRLKIYREYVDKSCWLSKCYGSR